jgi:hypothetical protein
MKSTGLLSSTALQGSGTGPTGFTPQDDGSDQQPNVSPEEQQQYNQFVQNGMQLLYTPDGKVEPEVLKRLSTGDKPIDTLAQTGVWLVMMLEQNAKQKGVQITDDVIMHGGRELFEQLADIDNNAGIHDFKQAELQGAWYNALDMYRESNSGPGDRIDPQQASAAFEALNEADKEGRADELVPGFYRQTENAVAMASKDQNAPQDEGTQGGDKKVLNSKATGNPNG